MNLYIQYHNVLNEDLPVSNPPFSETHLSIFTRQPNHQHAKGQVFLIAGIGQPRRYFLWETFQIENVTTSSDGAFRIYGDGWQLAPPIELSGKRFEDFKKACANFVGFRPINDLPYSKTLIKLARENRPPGKPVKIIRFLNTLDRFFPDDAPELSMIRSALGHFKPVRALSVRQPHAEGIMSGIKKIEYRTGPTKIRGRVFIYSSLGRYSVKEEQKWMIKYKIKKVECDNLPRGVIIGTVELFDCDDGEWYLRKPERAKKLIQPTKQPQPVWFYPF